MSFIFESRRDRPRSRSSPRCGVASNRATAQTPAKAAPIFVNGMAQVVPAFQDSSHVDPPGALGRDELRLAIATARRIACTSTSRVRARPTPKDSRSPILYGSSPYYAGTARGQVNWNVNQELERRAAAARRHGEAAVPGEPHAHLERARSTSGCRADSPSCTPRRRARAARRAARPSATIPSVCR